MSRGRQESVTSPEYGVLIDLIRQARIGSGLTQKEICDRLGKPKNYLIKIDRGERRLDLIELVRLCEAMGLDPLEFVRSFLQLR